MSQNRSPGDRDRVASALSDEGYAEADATAAWMRATVDCTPDGKT